MYLTSTPCSGVLTDAAPRAGVRLGLLLFGCLAAALLVGAMPALVRPCVTCSFTAFRPPLEPLGHSAQPSRDPAANAMPAIARAAGTIVPPAGVAPPSDTGRPFAAIPSFAEGPRIRPAWADAPLAPGGIGAPAIGAPGIGGGPLAAGPWTGATAWRIPDDRPRLTPFRADRRPPDASPAIATLDTGAGWSGPGQTRHIDYPGAAGDPALSGGLDQAMHAPSGQVAVAYWRAGLERHFLQIGAYGTDSGADRGSSRFIATTEIPRDAGVEARYDFIVNPGASPIGGISARTSVAYETRPSGNPATGLSPINTFRAAASWTFIDTITPSIQYFRTAGFSEATHFSWLDIRPNRAGMIAQVAYAPWGDSASPDRFLNLRFAARYVAYTDINGVGRAPAGNSAVYLSVWGALRF